MAIRHLVESSRRRSRWPRGPVFRAIRTRQYYWRRPGHEQGGNPWRLGESHQHGDQRVTDVVSSETGTYSATNLPPGTYRIEASLTGFQTAKSSMASG